MRIKILLIALLSSALPFKLYSFVKCNQVNILENFLTFQEKDSSIMLIRFKGDTLTLVTSNNELFYPFGQFIDFEDFTNNYLLKKKFKVKVDSSFCIFKIYTLQEEYSEIKIIENIETQRLEILSAIINSSSFEMYHGIKIGITMNNILSKYYIDTPIDFDNVNIIEIVSGLEGIWYYYHFSENKILKSISIRSDYIIKCDF